jgi:DNA mismatch endonuclease, patch repair protein
MGKLTKKQRSYCMSKIKSRNTSPELEFRKLINSKELNGYRIKNGICGKPDLYFSKKKIAVFIDGCFWHKCPSCFIAPKSNKDYWGPKLRRNVKRDKEINEVLKREKVKVIRFWEHEIHENLQKCYNRFIKIYEKT